MAPETPADVSVLMRITQAISHRTFGGRLDMRRLHFAERAVVRMTQAPEGDTRDWDAVNRFAAEIADELVARHTAA
jgi:menaquinone-dependent protoporphyrinogen oxidase